MSAAITVAYYSNNIFVSLFAVIVVGARQHALFVLIHEAAHMHMAQNKLVNDWTADLFCAFPLIFDTDIYRKNHLKHHRHLNTDQDPDWIRKVGLKDWTFPMSAGQLARFVPMYVLYYGPIEWATILWRFSGFGDKQRWKTQPYFLTFKLVYFIGGASLIYALQVPWQALAHWFAAMFFVLPLVGRIRSIAEHFAVSYHDELNSTREVRAGWIEGFLLAPHQVHYHLTHHIHPHVPFYHLKEVHQQLTDAGQFASAHINKSYLLPFSDSVLHDMLYGPKETQAQSLKEVG